MKGKNNNFMDYRRLTGLSINDLEDLNIEDDDTAYGGIERNKDKKIASDINRKKFFNQDQKDRN